VPNLAEAIVELTKFGLSSTVRDNIWNKTTINPDTNCWQYLNTDYPRVYFNYNLTFLHRIIACIYHGLTLDSKLLSLHKTICPNKNCWNPEHIYVGSHSENTLDSVKIGTHNSNLNRLKTHCTHGHEYTKENTRIQKNNGKRQCRECDKNRKRINGELGWKKMNGNGSYSSKGKHQ
jgi:hypothetical protein